MTEFPADEAKYPEQLLGFDARVAAHEVLQLWSREQRDAYLLKSEDVCPLSTDTMVWPSLFDTTEGASHLPSSFPLRNLPAPSWMGSNAPFFAYGLWLIEKRPDDAAG